MISQIYWLVPHHVLYWKMSGCISGIEICEMSRFITTQVSQLASRKVHIIIDSAGVTQLDYTNHEAREAFHRLANQVWMGKVIAIIHSYQIQAHLNALSGGFGLNWENVASVQAAIRSLKKVDNLLQDVPILQPSSLIVRPE